MLEFTSDFPHIGRKLRACILCKQIVNEIKQERKMEKTYNNKQEYNLLEHAVTVNKILKL